MYVRSIQLRRFRRFESRVIELDPRILLITGNNGAGRSTVLDAVAVALSALIEGLGVPARGVAPGDLRRGSGPDDEGAPPRPSIVCHARIDGVDHLWERTGAADDMPPPTLAAGVDSTLPIFAHHRRVARAVTAAALPSPRLAAYVGCLEIGDPEPAVVAQLSSLLAEIAASGARPPALVAVEIALTECLGDSAPVVFSAADAGSELLVTIGDTAPVPFAELGGASRRIGSLVADLALRACVANPHLGTTAPGATPGVALIDDLDAGLHPRWQRYLLDDLRRVFPRIQILATTTSPFLLQALHAGDYLDLDGRRRTAVTDLSIEDLTEEVLGVRMPQRSKRFHDLQRAATEVMELVRGPAPIDAKEKALLQARLDAKMVPYSNDPAWTAVLMMERIGRGLADPAATTGGDSEGAS